MAKPPQIKKVHTTAMVSTANYFNILRCFAAISTLKISSDSLIARFRVIHFVKVPFDSEIDS